VKSEDGPPRARVGGAQDFLAFLDHRQPGTRQHFSKVLPALISEAISERARTDWLDVETIDGPFVTAVVEWLGSEEAREAWRTFTCTTFVRTPALRPIVDGAVRVFGLSVSSLLKVFPLGYQQSYRGCAVVTTRIGHGEASLEMELTPVYARVAAYAVQLHGVFLAIYDIARTRPRLEYAPDLRSGVIRACFRW